VRPTAEEVRVATMELLASDLKGARVLDLFAGTGALALEALSRGAASADLIERNPAALHALKANVAKVRASKLTRIFKKDALAFMAGIRPPGYDVAFVDPPYTSRLAARVVESWKKRPFSTLLVVETARDAEVPKGGKSRRVGDSTITLYRSRERPASS
jgi:16S rRNA (guanine966-N2)-methyltransferase